MHYQINFSCVSHIGKIRSMNQDNFICDGRYMDVNGAGVEFPLCGTKFPDERPVFGIFDGMGGEECGEIASFIAAENASNIKIGKDAAADMAQFCHDTNDNICEYAALNGVSAMGTTAAMLAFTDKEIALCNIGDSKVFRWSDGILEQISKDHITVSAFGVKPPLSQNLGIPPTEFIIEPYLARGAYQNGDVYLICSDGLTDMVATEEISEVLMTTECIWEGIELLLNKALENGGKDNITMMLLAIQRRKNKLLDFFRKNGGNE